MKKHIENGLKDVYRQVPPSVALRLAGVIRGLVSIRDYGPAYRKTLSQIRQTEFGSREQLTMMQLELLREVVGQAWTLCPGYRCHWEAHGFEPSQLKSLDDIQRIPFITKSMLRDNFELFSVPAKGGTRKLITTSGSGGIPLRLYYDRVNEAKEAAFIHDLWSRRGFQPGMRTLTIRGASVTGGYKENPYAELSLYGELLLSAYHIGPETASHYAAAIYEFRPECIQAYPSALALLSRVFLSQNFLIKMPGLKCIILASEKLYERDAKAIQAVFPTRIVHFYGMTELAALGGPCEINNEFHLYPQYGIAEVLKNDGSAAGEGEFGELVGTSFLMRQTPIIRYRTADIVRKSTDRCDGCGREYPLISEVIGRSSEYIYTEDNAQVPFSMAIGSIHDSTFEGIRRFQFVQQKAGELIFQYEASNQWPEGRLRELEKLLRQKIGHRLSLTGAQVEAIACGPNGKYSFFKSML